MIKLLVFNQELATVENEKQLLVSELDKNNRQMEENLNRHKTTVEANAEAKLDSAIKENLARARLEWLKEQSDGEVGDLVHVEKSLGKFRLFLRQKQRKMV